MQQQIVEQNKIKDRRPGKGRAMALSRRIYRLQNTDIFYVESETSDDQYYICKFKPDVLDSWYCSCKDNSIRGLKCKHLFTIEFAIRWGTIKDVDKQLLSSFVKRDNNTATIPPNIVGEDAEYDF